ncbi:MAG: aminotransferase class IV [Candidatus Marinimicrobia bacterium]|nr:aminotransferase class IV [Candidatus Neomarinimicrobiota bacterium]
MAVYFNNSFVPESDQGSLPVEEAYFMEKNAVRIAPDDRGFTFGDGIYEVLKAYSGNIFAEQMHLSRLANSLAAIRLPDFDTTSLVPIMQSLLERNNLEQLDAKIYIQITRGVAPRDHAFPKIGVPLTVFISAGLVMRKSSLIESGVKAILTDDIRWSRCDIKQIGLLAGVLANQEAKEADAYEALFVRNGFITEGTHTNFCALIDGKLHTHPANNYILPGVTRAVVIAICNELNIPVIEEPIAAADLQQTISDGADVECMVLGTITEIMPIIQIDDLPIGNRQPGELTRKIISNFQKITTNL